MELAGGRVWFLGWPVPLTEAAQQKLPKVLGKPDHNASLWVRKQG